MDIHREARSTVSWVGAWSQGADRLQQKVFLACSVGLMGSGREITHLVLSCRGNPVIVMLSEGAAFLRASVGALIPAIGPVQSSSWVLDAQVHDHKLRASVVLPTLLELLKPGVRCMTQTGVSVVQRGAELY